MMINNKSVDSLSISELTASIMNTHLKFQGPNGVKYIVADVNHATMMTSLKRFSFYLNHYVTDLDHIKIKTAIAKTWTQILGRKFSPHYVF